MRGLAVLVLSVLIVGCYLDRRPQALRRGVDQVRSVLAEPKLHSLAIKQTGKTPEDRLVEALFSSQARALWPPRRPPEYDFDYSDAAGLPRRIAYLRAPDLPWSVVVTPDPAQHQVLLQGYGQTLDTPLVTDTVPVAP